MSPIRSPRPALLALALLALAPPGSAGAQQATDRLQVTDAAAPCADLRHSPRPAAKSKRCVPPGTTVSVLRSFEDWRRVRLDDGVKGWLPATLLAATVTEAAAEPGTGPAPPAGAPARKTRVLVPLAWEEQQREAAPDPAPNPTGDPTSDAVLRAALAAAEARGRELEEELQVARQRHRELSERLAKAEAANAELRLPAAAPAAGALSANGTPEDLQPAIEAWAAAWSEQRVEDYLAFYAPDFRPPGGGSRSEWEAARRRRLAAPDYIRVTLSTFGVRPLGPDRASVRFTQRYESDTYEDVVQKRLELVRVGGAWKILEEVSEGA